jgi:hypothetical protein
VGGKTPALSHCSRALIFPRGLYKTASVMDDGVRLGREWCSDPNWSGNYSRNKNKRVDRFWQNNPHKAERVTHFPFFSRVRRLRLTHMTYVVGSVHLNVKSVWIIELERFL